MENEKNNIKKKDTLLFAFLLVLTLLPLVSSVTITDTTFFSINSNSTIYVSSITLDQVVVEANYTEFYNFTGSSNFTNTNVSSTAEAHFYGLNNALIYYYNGTLLQQEFTGNINITFAPSNSLVIENNFLVDVPTDDGTGGEGSSDVNQDGGSGDIKLNNSLSGSVLIKILNLNNSFIYFSNRTINTLLDGDLNITLNQEEYFYIVNYEELLKLNENSGTIAYDVSGNSRNTNISGATYDNDNILITLTNIIDYTLDNGNGNLVLDNFYLYDLIIVNWNHLSSISDDLNSITRDSSMAYTNISKILPTVGTIIGIIILLLILVGAFVFVIMKLMKINKDKNNDLKNNNGNF